jgi:shikimate dehydrogenase
MARFGLIGYPLSHSYSALYFPEYSYQLFPLPDLAELPVLLKAQPGLTGLNVTIPYKERIIPYLHHVMEPAGKIGAVNVVRIREKDGDLYLEGYNTDAEGFRKSADFSGHREALILGTGGAAKAVAYVLQELGMAVHFVSRAPAASGILSYPQLTPEVMVSHTLIVNATPLGMYPAQETFPPIPYELLTERHFLYDLVYNPPITLFLKRGAHAGCRLQNGETMLRLQAEASYRIFNSEG